MEIGVISNVIVWQKIGQVFFFSPLQYHPCLRVSYGSWMVVLAPPVSSLIMSKLRLLNGCPRPSSIIPDYE